MKRTELETINHVAKDVYKTTGLEDFANDYPLRYQIFGIIMS